MKIGEPFKTDHDFDHVLKVPTRKWNREHS